MKESKIQIPVTTIDAIAKSDVLSESEKLQSLKYVGYLTRDEQWEYCELV